MTILSSSQEQLISHQHYKWTDMGCSRCWTTLIKCIWTHLESMETLHVYIYSMREVRLVLQGIIDKKECLLQLCICSKLELRRDGRGETRVRSVPRSRWPCMATATSDGSMLHPSHRGHHDNAPRAHAAMMATLALICLFVFISDLYMRALKAEPPM